MQMLHSAAHNPENSMSVKMSNPRVLRTGRPVERVSNVATINAGLWDAAMALAE
jgi:hypothetical protein